MLSAWLSCWLPEPWQSVCGGATTSLSLGFGEPLDTVATFGLALFAGFLLTIITLRVSGSQRH
jgi:hypothetical protein